jgi:dihydroneopterin aldolase
LTTDSIRISGLEVLGRHGALAHEKERAQPFQIDLELEAALTEAARSDDITKTVDYGAVVEMVIAVVEGSSFSLIEALAEAIALEVLSGSGAEAVTVEVRKVRPPLEAHVSSVGVRLRRTLS